MSRHLPQRPSSSNFSVLAYLYRFLAPYRRQVIISLLALLVTAAVTLSIGQGLRILIDQGFAGDGSQLNQTIGIFLGLVVVLAVFTFIRFYHVSWVGERVVADIRRAVFDHVVALHPGFFDSNHSGEIQSRITTDTTLLQNVIGSSVSFALRNFLVMIGGIIWLFITNPKLTAIVMIAVPLVMVPILFFGKRVRKLSRDSQDKVANVGTYVGEAIKNIKVVQAFNHQQEDTQAFSLQVEDAFNVAIKRIYQRAWLTTLAIFLVLGAIAGMLWVGGNDVIAGRITAGELTAFVFYAVMVAASVGAISEVYGELQRAAGATERLIELLTADNLVQSPSQPTRLPAQVQGAVSIRDIGFAYPTRLEQPAIKHLSLEIPPATVTALVGSSGAGKSTLIDLLLRFYDVQQGAILFDGVDIRELDLDELRRHIALVPQQPVLFSGTIRDNILYGLPGASEAQIIAAATAAYAHDFITALPDGYNSLVGEGGVRLSGGQRQRVAIARALLKDPRLLLLDEATSALDAESEFQVQKALEELMKNRTTVVIAHRLATVIKADNIAVLDHGQLVATGTHRELLSSSPLYARWASLQFDNANSVASAMSESPVESSVSRHATVIEGATP